MVGQKVQSASVEKKIDETHTASLAEFELAKESRANNAEELAELKEISREIQILIAQVEKKLPR